MYSRYFLVSWSSGIAALATDVAILVVTLTLVTATSEAAPKTANAAHPLRFVVVAIKKIADRKRMFRVGILIPI